MRTKKSFAWLVTGLLAIGCVAHAAPSTSQLTAPLRFVQGESGGAYFVKSVAGSAGSPISVTSTTVKGLRGTIPADAMQTQVLKGSSVVASGSPAPDGSFSFPLTGSVVQGDPLTVKWVVPNLQPASLQFNGNGNHVTIPHRDAYNSDSLTVEAWVKPNSFNWLGGIVGKYQGASANDFFLRLGGTAPYDKINWGVGDTAPINGTTSLAASQWYHVAGTFDAPATKLTLYLNGEIDGSGTGAVRGKANQEIHIGADYMASPRWFSGSIAEVRIWNVSRSQADIKANMNKRLTGAEAGLVGYWRLNENAGSVALDASTLSNHGSLIGPTWTTDAPASLQ